MPTKSLILRAWEVRALLDRRLTQVRRVVKPQPIDADLFEIICDGKVHYRRPTNDPMLNEARNTPGYSVRTVIDGLITKSPYAVGDTFAVKETWLLHYTDDDWDNDLVLADVIYNGGGKKRVTVDRYKYIDSDNCRWRSPVTMPIWASRLSRVVTGVRVERVHEISEQDAVKCGVEALDAYHNQRDFITSVANGAGLSELASSIYGDQWCIDNPRYPWESNPWCWVYELGEVK